MFIVYVLFWRTTIFCCCCLAYGSWSEWPDRQSTQKLKCKYTYIKNLMNTFCKFPISYSKFNSLLAGLHLTLLRAWYVWLPRLKIRNIPEHQHKATFELVYFYVKNLNLFNGNITHLFSASWHTVYAVYFKLIERGEFRSSRTYLKWITESWTEQLKNWYFKVNLICFLNF